MKIYAMETNLDGGTVTQESLSSSPPRTTREDAIELIRAVGGDVVDAPVYRYSGTGVRQTPSQALLRSRLQDTVRCNGHTHTIEQWAVMRNMNPITLAGRLTRGWTIDRALNEPVGAGQRLAQPRILPWVAT